MRYPIMSSRDDDNDQSPRGRLRVPAALAVAFVGTSAAASMWYGGCHTETDPPVDALVIESRDDGGGIDVADNDPPDDAGVEDAPRDAAPADTPPV
jgi:hypothetical protein